MKTLISKVKGFEGECKPTWLNTNQVDRRLDGGVTGFFKRTKNLWIFKVKFGESFHGIIRGNEVHTTEGIME